MNGTANSQTWRKRYLRIRELAGKPPLPEEMLGLCGPDEPDDRDRIKQPEKGRVEPINLLSALPLRIRDQGRTNRCGGFAGVAGLSMLMQKALHTGEALSANDLYWFAREKKGEDSGVYMRGLMNAMLKHGAAAEWVWPDGLSPLERPDGMDEPNVSKRRFRILGYERVLGVDDAVKVLSVERLPIWVGATLFRDSSARAARTGDFDMPERGDIVTGGHAMLIVGWEWRGGKRWFILVNSWGYRAGRNGLFSMPEDYIAIGYASDLWTVSKNYF